MLDIQKLEKSFGEKRAVQGLSFTVEKGTVLGFLGPNGAGKSTTMRMIAGVLEPDSGDATIDGKSIVSARREAQAALGYLPEGAPLYDDMTPPEFLAFMAAARSLPGPNVNRQSNAPLRTLAFPPFADKGSDRSPRAIAAVSAWPAPSCMIHQSCCWTSPPMA